MNIRDHGPLREKLAAEYVLGTHESVTFWRSLGVLADRGEVTLALTSKAIGDDVALLAVSLGAEGRFAEPGRPRRSDPAQRCLGAGDVSCYHRRCRA